MGGYSERLVFRYHILQPGSHFYFTRSVSLVLPYTVTLATYVIPLHRSETQLIQWIANHDYLNIY